MSPVVPDTDALAFYAVQSRISSPGRHAGLLDSLPTDIRELCAVIQGMLVHQFWITDESNYGITPAMLKAQGRDLNREINIRSTEAMLGAILELDDAPLTRRREPARRLVGNCRDYSLILTSILRHRGIPARVRSGVARYFYPDGSRLEDHFVCEFWNGEEARWQLVDAQIDDRQREVLTCDLDTTDLSKDQFLVAVDACEELRAGRIGENAIGIFDFTGWRYVRYTLFSDLACVSSVEILAWEGWGICDRIMSDNLTAADAALLADGPEHRRGDPVE